MSQLGADHLFFLGLANNLTGYLTRTRFRSLE